MDVLKLNVATTDWCLGAGEGEASMSYLCIIESITLGSRALIKKPNFLYINEIVQFPLLDSTRGYLSTAAG